MTEMILSASNPKVKLVRSLMQKKGRTKNGLYTVEGIKSVKDAHEAGADIKMIFISEENTYMADDFSQYSCFTVSENIFAGMCDTKTPQGILAVIAMKEKPLKTDKNKMYICCDNVRDPGNLGTIIRTADAAGFGGVILYGECADLYSPKTVRSSMGSFFHIPVYENASIDDMQKIKNDGFKIWCGALSDNCVNYTETDFSKPFVVCVGNEANGISEEIEKLADGCVKIPIEGEAESLNVGIAAAVLMYEAVRQRTEI